MLFHVFVFVSCFCFGFLFTLISLCLVITKPDFSKLLERLNVQSTNLGREMLFQALDLNRDGQISLEEFVAGFRLLGEKEKKAPGITSVSLQKIASEYDHSTWSELFAAVDTNKVLKKQRKGAKSKKVFLYFFFFIGRSN